MRILVVDDYPAFAASLAFMLRQEGHLTAIAAGGRDAIAKLASDSAFDVILLDSKMPEVPGAVVVETLSRVSPDLVDRVILMTGDLAGQGQQPALVGLRSIEKPFAYDRLAPLLSRPGPR